MKISSAHLQFTRGNRTARLRLLAALCSVLMVVLGVVSAAVQPVTAYEFVEGYYTPASGQIVVGMYVSKAEGDGLVTPTTTVNADAALGVASSENGGLLTLTKKESNVFVATTGTLPVFITDITGKVSDGDFLSASTIPGVLKKATDKDDYILGVARGELDDSKKEEIKTLELTNSLGEKSNISVGLVSIDIKRFANPGKVSKNALQKISEAIVKKPVPIAQVIFGGLFFIIALISILVLVSTAVRSSIASIGRNPLAKKSIMRGLYQVIFLAAIILVVGLAGTYIILWI